MLFFYVKQQKHCHHIVLCATVYHMDVEKWRATFLEEKAAETLLFSSLHWLALWLEGNNLKLKQWKSSQDGIC